MPDVFEEVTDLKNTVRLQRKDRDFAGAKETLRIAIDKLDEALTRVAHRQGPASQFEKKVAKQLADFHGANGGNYRDLGDYKKSAAEYYIGYEFESNPRYGIVDSYNMVNRLISRLLDQADFD